MQSSYKTAYPLEYVSVEGRASDKRLPNKQKSF